MTTAPLELLSDVAVAAQASTGIRSVVDRAPAEWRTDPTGAPYIVVSHVSPIGPELTGDGVTIGESTQVQASLWETRNGEDPDRALALWAALDGVAVGGRALRGGVEGMIRLPDKDTDLIQHVTTVRYPLLR